MYLGTPSEQSGGCFLRILHAVHNDHGGNPRVS